MRVLIYLSERQGEVVHSEDLMHDLWSGKIVTDATLYNCIKELRDVLDEGSDGRSAIQTVTKKGYRLRLPVSGIDAPEPHGTVKSAPQAASGYARRWIWLSLVGLMLAASAILIVGRQLAGPGEAVSATEAGPPVHSIAVLAFNDLSPEGDQEYFSDGLSDTLIHVLAQVSGLRVTSKSSSFYFKGKGKSIGEIARELNVGTVLAGSVQKVGNRVRVNVELVNAEDGAQLWSKSFDRDLQDIFAVQDEIAQETVKALEVTLLESEQERLALRYRPTLEAYDYLVLGRYEMAKRTGDSLSAAERHFKRAIELDPDYALAYVGLANTLALQLIYAGLNQSDTFPLRRTAIDKALALDPQSGEAYAALAMLTAEQGEDAEPYYMKAIALSPNNAGVHHKYAIHLRNLGDRNDEALAHIRRAVELSPLEPVLTSALSGILFGTGRIEEANEILRAGIERNPQFLLFYARMSLHLSQLGQIGKAMKWTRAGIDVGRPQALLLKQECWTYLQLDDIHNAERCAQAAVAAFPEDPYPMLNIHLFRYEYQTVIELIEELVRQSPSPTAINRENLAFAYFMGNELEQAGRIWQELRPDLFGEGAVVVRPTELINGLPILAGHTMYVNGDTDRANYIFDQALETMRSMHRTRGSGYFIWDAFIYATRGENDRAISALRDAIETGWRVDWWFYPRLSAFDSVRDEPEWIELMGELKADIARQRQWYEEHKDDPLF
jgi:TolB-like protein/Tfp pilus assembly protein PilF